MEEHLDKLNQMKLKPGLAAFYARIQCINTDINENKINSSSNYYYYLTTFIF